MTADSVTMSKDLIRRRMRNFRENLPPKDFEMRGKRAQQNLLACSLWQNAPAVGLYLSLSDEMPTSLLLDNALTAGKEVWVPKIIDAALGKMEFWLCASVEVLVPGPFGVLEPRERQKAKYAPSLIVVPGLAFDKQGFRVGYGGGYYDRWLYAQAKKFIPVCGMAFEFQIVDNLPHEPWDMRVHGICTEESLKWL